MMLSIENYYESYLKNKSEKEIITVIRGLKQRIGVLKKSIESPDDSLYFKINPSDESKINFYRLYLEEAKKALKKVGEIYKLSQAELRSLDFMNNINHIIKLSFTIGGFPELFNNFVVDLSKNQIKLTNSTLQGIKLIEVLDEKGDMLTKKTFLEGIQKLYMGEWRRHYSLSRFGYQVLDGTCWDIEIEYDNGHRTICFDGNNSYPYNFSQFQKLFGIDN